MSKNTNLSFLTDYITADITNGRIGINTPSPTVAFDVTGATKITGVLTLTSTISNGTYAYTLPSATGTLALTSAISGTTGYIPKFTSSTAIGNSSLQDDGSNVFLSNGYYTTIRTDNTSVLRTHLLMQRGSGAGTYADIFTAGDTTNGVASIHFGFNSSSKMVITAAGNVGIGTSSPTSQLEIYDNSNSGILRLSRDAGNQRGALEFGRNNGGSFQTCGSIIVDSDAASVNNGLMYFYTSNSSGTNTERMRINAAGNVLINGTTAQNTATNRGNLTIDGTSSIINLSVSSTNGGYICHLGTDMLVANVKNGYMTFETNNTERMRILSSGNIGIGMTTSTYNRVSIKSNSATAYAGLAVYAASNGDWLYMNHTGTVGIIGTDYDGSAGAAHTPILIYCGNDERMRFSTNGNIGAGGGTTNIYNASDIRLKKNIIPITLGLNAISALNPVKFNWADGFDEIEADKTLLGFIAQEVQVVIPEAVETFGGNSLTIGDTVIDNPLRVNEKFIIPVLVKAIQELSAEITILKNK